MSLFRKQVMEQQYNSMWGAVLLSLPLSYRLISTVFLVIIGSVIAFLISIDYQRKEQVNGLIIPSEGVSQLFSPGRLIVEKQLVKEGDKVTQGQALFQLASPKHLGSGEEQNQLQTAELAKQIDLLKSQLTTLKIRHKHVLKHTQTQLTEQLKTLDLLNKELGLARSKSKLNQQQLSDFSAVVSSGHISKNQLIQLQKSQHELHKAELIAKRQIKQTELAIEQLKHQTRQAPVEHEQSVQQIHLSISEKQLQLNQIKAQAKVLIRATVTGHLTALSIYPNQWLKPEQYIATIVPEQPEFYAEVYVPSRAAGFIKKGQQTRLKLNAFPYQKFGVLKGTISSKSSHTLPHSANDGQSNLGLYKVKVALEKQNILAYGNTIPLQSGMELAADILIDKRSLWEWLLAPLYTLRG